MTPAASKRVIGSWCLANDFKDIYVLFVVLFAAVVAAAAYGRQQDDWHAAVYGGGGGGDILLTGERVSYKLNIIS